MLCVGLENHKVHGGLYEHVLNKINISANKNTLRGDLSALKPSGMRYGAPAMTTRGCIENDFYKIAEFMNRAVKITSRHNRFEKLLEFKKHINALAKNGDEEIA